MAAEEREEELLRSVALQNATSILLARQRAEEERLRAQEALEVKSEELAHSLAMMRATLESTTDAILVTDGSGRVTGFNEKFLEIWRIPREALGSRLHRDILEVTSRQLSEPEPFITRVEAIYATSPVDSHDLLELADGRFIERFSRIQSVNGRNVGRVWSFRDITERKRLEEARFRLAAIVESTDDAIISKTLDGIIVTWNKGAEAIFGYSADEVIGCHITLLIPLERLNEESVILDKLRRGERVEQYETVRKRKDGTFFDVSLTVSPVKDVTGKIIGASKIARDITHRKRTDEALREETRILELLNRTGKLIASQLDLRRLVQAVTDAATKLSGAKFGAFFYNVSNDQGESFVLYTLSGAPREAFENFGLPRNTPVFDPTFRGEGVVRSADITKDPRYGQMAPHHGMPQGHLPVRSYLAAPVVSRSGNVIGGLFFGHPEAAVFTERAERLIVGVASQAAVAIDNARLYDDVKRLAEEREALLDAERAARAEAERVSLLKDEFLANVSHELRTPLNAILGWSQLIATGKVSSEDLKQGLETIGRNSRIQAQLIEDLLDVSRIVSGKVRLDVQQTELATVVEQAVSTVRPSAEAKGIRLRQIIDPLIGPVTGDPSRLQQVVWNLLSNAVKFTPKGGMVEVLLQRVNSHLEITVSDSGMGIKPEFLPHVFERFRQGDSSTARTYGGLGLGLTIVKQIVELHGGTVRAQSAGEDQGATFIVSLPLAPVRADEKREHPATPTSTVVECGGIDLAGVRVLVVEDDPDARELIKRVLDHCHAEVLVAAGAADAIQVLKTYKVHVLVSDIGLPVTDGYQFIRQVRRLRPAEGGNVPAIALTAFARSEDRTRALMAGYQIHIAKPIEPQELAATVASIAGRTLSST